MGAGWADGRENQLNCSRDAGASRGRERLAHDTASCDHRLAARNSGARSGRAKKTWAVVSAGCSEPCSESSSIAASLVGIEILSSFYVPAWPARAMNPREPAPVRHLATSFKNQPWLADPDNSWGMRDSERTIENRQEPGARSSSATASSICASRHCRCRQRCSSAHSPTTKSRRLTSASRPPTRAAITTVSATWRWNCSPMRCCSSSMLATTSCLPTTATRSCRAGSTNRRAERCSGWSCRGPTGWW